MKTILFFKVDIDSLYNSKQHSIWTIFSRAKQERYQTGLIFISLKLLPVIRNPMTSPVVCVFLFNEILGVI